MSDCPAFDPTGPYVSHVLGMVDCHLLGVAETGWQAFGPGSAFGAALTGLLTILIALVGYGLLLGRRLRLRDGVWVALRIGVVVALATQWSAWDALVFRIATQAPQEWASAVLGPGGLGGEDRYGLALRIDRTSAAFDDLAKADTLPGEGASPQPRASTMPGAAIPQAPPMLTPEARKNLTAANGLLVVSALAGLLAVRAVVALLLALGPVFVVSLLFETTRGLFAGWVRAVVGAMLAAVAVPLVLALELAVMEPQLRAMQALIGGSTSPGALPMQIWASAAVFTGVMVVSALGVARAATAFRFPDGVRNVGEGWAAAIPVIGGAGALVGGTIPAQSRYEGRSRAQRIADAAISAQRRDNALWRSDPRRIRQTSLARASVSGEPMSPSALPIGQVGRQPDRNRARRASGGANRRDDQR